MRTQMINRVAAVAVVAVALVAARAIYAAPEQEMDSRRPESIVIEPGVVPEPPGRQVPPRPARAGFDVEIWTDRQTYDIGDLVRIYFRVTRPSYVYIFNTDTEGRTHQLFPNYYDRDNDVVPGRRYFIPDASYRLRVTGPAGTEHLRIVAVRYRAIGYERRHPVSPREPFPLYLEGAKGFLREYEREERGPESVRSRGQREISPQSGGPSGGPSSGRQPETIVIEPRDSARAIVVEPPDLSYDREWVEAYTSFRVIDRYPLPVPVYHGQLDVTSRPSGARVYVDGRYRGRAPLSVRYLESGFHTVEVSLPGYDRWAGDIEVREGGRAVVNVRLRQQRPTIFFDFRF